MFLNVLLYALWPKFQVEFSFLGCFSALFLVRFRGVFRGHFYWKNVHLKRTYTVFSHLQFSLFVMTARRCCCCCCSRIELRNGKCADEVLMLARRFTWWLAEWRICRESRSLSRSLARKGGIPKIRYWQQNWFTCGSASGRGFFPRLGSLW